MNKERRIFVIWLSDLTTKVLKGEIRSTDVVLIFAPDNTEVQEIPFFKGQEHKIHQPLEDIDNIIKNIRIYAKNKNDIVYLVGQIMSSLYTELSNVLKKGIRGVYKSDSFKVKERNAPENVAMLDPTLLDYLSVMQQSAPEKLTEPDTSSIPETSIHECTGENKDYSKSAKNPVKRTTRKPTQPSSSAKTDKKEVSSQDKDRRNKKRTENNNPQSSEKPQQQPKQTKPTHKVNLSELEAAVFGNQVEAVTYEAEFTALQDLKARTASKMFERLKDHIHFFTKKELEEKRYFNFAVLLTKTTSNHEFLESWNIMAPEYAVQLKTEEYLRLRGEAVYYGQVCDLLYKEDVWNY